MDADNEILFPAEHAAPADVADIDDVPPIDEVSAFVVDTMRGNDKSFALREWQAQAIPELVGALFGAKRPVLVNASVVANQSSGYASYFRLRELVVAWNPYNADHDGEIYPGFLAPEENSTLTDYEYMRGYPDAYHRSLVGRVQQTRGGYSARSFG
jgi:hypothetical protein